LLKDAERREALASASRRYVEQRFGWDRIGRLQVQLWREVITGIRVRPAARGDLPAIARIQSLCESASHWEAESYFDFDVHVAERHGAIAGFVVSRSVFDELEVLNLAVDPDHRRSGVATVLLEYLDSPHLFLEVRESNLSAQSLYSKMGFQTVGRRENYYEDPPETALVMRLSRIPESDKF
jgi:ribosomal-protein-alanine N-acetyltransferase